MLRLKKATPFQKVLLLCISLLALGSQPVIIRNLSFFSLNKRYKPGIRTFLFATGSIKKFKTQCK
jgi:hypothetical protein